MVANAKGNPADRYDRSSIETTTIGAAGQSTGRLEMGRKYAFYRIRILDCSNLAANTAMRMQTAPSPAHQLCDLYETNNPVARWSKGDLPVTGSVDFELTHAMNCQSLNIQLTVGATGTVTFEVMGSDSAL